MIVMPLLWTGSGAILNAEKCASCLTCVRVCPYQVPIVQDGVVRLETSRCQACGICATECPAKAITMMYHRDELMFRLIEALFKKFPEPKPVPTIIGFRCCPPGYTSGSEQIACISAPDNVGVINAVCTAKIDISYVLKAFELGADGVFVTACPEGECLHTTGNQFARKRVESLKKLLDDLGLGSQRLDIFNIPPGDNSRLAQVAVEMTERVKELGRSPLRRQ